MRRVFFLAISSVASLVMGLSFQVTEWAMKKAGEEERFNRAIREGLQ